jgi:DNA-binding transcriptional regulator YiaG
LRLVALLDEYRQLREQRLSAETKKKQAAAGLLITGLQQRLLSSIEAFSRTLRVHRRTVLRHWEEAQRVPPGSASEQLDLVSATVDADDDRAGLSEDELRSEEDLQIEAATAASAAHKQDASASLFAKEQRLLDAMTNLAEASRGLPDARVQKLIDWMRANMCPKLPHPGQPRKGGETWTDIRIIIFTEWDDTKRYLVQQLTSAIEGTDRADERIAVYHGPTPVEERERIKRAFNADPSTHPLRILVATDAAREGLNLQAHCWNLFHFDVPWNPSKMEQRNGRIDRKLQPNAEVFCHYFFYKQRPEDRIIAALVRKTETISKELGSLGQVIDAKLHKTMSRGISRNRVDAIENEIKHADLEADARATVDEELEASRERQNELREQIDRLRTRLDESKRNIGFDQDHFRGALSSSLELMHAPPLKQVRAGAKEWQFPALDQRGGADPRWADTMDTLRAPRQKDQKPWEWRSTSPIRPVVFEDPGVVTDDVVHLHLEHRVVQRLLGRFMAQGFVYDDLARACLAQSSDAVPRVMLLGRLCLYGHGAARLHEELIPIAARWVDPKIRKDKLSPYAREAETRTLDLLDEAIRKPKTNMPDVVLKQLQASAAQDVQELLHHLQSRGDEHAAIAEKKLRDRGDTEAKAMRSILEDQQKHIASTVAKHAKEDVNQLRLKFGDDEMRQLDANKKYWAKRMTMLAQELESEPARIRDVYEVKAKRIEPVGLIYLWPVTG